MISVSNPRVNLRVYFRKIFGAEQRLKQNLARDFGAAFNNLITVLQENIKQ